MMSSLIGQATPDMMAQGPVADTCMFEGTSTRDMMLMDSMRRLSRGANCQRPGGAMRIVKPSSTSNSPQSMAARRRTLMNDGNMTRRCQQVLGQASLQPPYNKSRSSPPTSNPEPIKRSTRPMSWHPGSYQIQQTPQQQQQQQQQQSYFNLQPAHQQPMFSAYSSPVPMGFGQQDYLAAYQQIPPTPSVYSGHASPSSSISPETLPFPAYQQSAVPHGLPTDAWDQRSFAPAMYDAKASPAAYEPFPQYTNGPATYDWSNLDTQGYHQASTAPPTPDDFQLPQQSQPPVPAEESIPYQALDESEDEGEILVGMGLYDTPGKSDTDPELDNYRTSTSSLLGTTYRRGQGLKLEEAWEPPASDDEEGEDEDAEAEGDDD